MAKDDFDTAPMILTFYTEGFGEMNYSVPINGAFEVTTPLQAFELEARAKGCAVVIQVALIPVAELMGDQPEEVEGEISDE